MIATLLPLAGQCARKSAAAQERALLLLLLLLQAAARGAAPTICAGNPHDWPYMKLVVDATPPAPWEGSSSVFSPI